MKKIRKLQEVRECEVGECGIEAEKIRRRRSRPRCREVRECRNKAVKRRRRRSRAENNMELI